MMTFASELMLPSAASVAVFVLLLSSMIFVGGSERAQTGAAHPSLKKSVAATASEPPVRRALMSVPRRILPGTYPVSFPAIATVRTTPPKSIVAELPSSTVVVTGTRIGLTLTRWQRFFLWPWTLTTLQTRLVLAPAGV